MEGFGNVHLFITILSFFQEGEVHVNNLDNILKRLGIKLSEEEFAKLSEDLPVDGQCSRLPRHLISVSYLVYFKIDVTDGR